MTQRSFFTLLLVLALALLAYANTFPNDFVWDDEAFILENTHVQNPMGFTEFFKGSVASGASRESPYYRPLYMLSFWLDCRIWGLEPFGFHLTNALLHLANCVLLFLLVSRLAAGPKPALLAAAFFAVHPALTEAVASISGRGWPLVSAFLLTSLRVFVSYRERRWFGRGDPAPSEGEAKSRPLLLLSALLFFLALLTMEIAMIFPLLLLLYDGFNALGVREKKIKEVLRPHGLFWLLLGIFLLMRFTLMRLAWFSYGSDWHLDRRILTAPMILIAYLGILLFPVTLRLERTIPFAKSLSEPLTAFAWLGLLALVFFLVFLIRRRRHGLFVFGVLWMLVALLPALNIFPLRAMMAEAWLYVPAMGFSMALASLFSGGGKRFSRLKAAAAGLLIVFFVFRTALRNFDWRDNVTLYEASVQNSPSSVKPQYNLAVAYSRAGRFVDAKREFEKIGREKKRYMRDYNRNFYSD